MDPTQQRLQRTPPPPPAAAAGAGAPPPPPPAAAVGLRPPPARAPPAPSGPGHWGMGEYMAMKISKLGAQNAAALAAAGGAASAALAGVGVLVNGRTHPDAAALRDLVLRHGGTFHNYYARGAVTHIVASTLPPAKVAAWRAEKSPTPVVLPAWLVDSAAAGRPLPVGAYLLPELRPAGQRTLADALAAPQGRREREEEEAEEAPESGGGGGQPEPAPAGGGPPAGAGAGAGAAPRRYDPARLAAAHALAARLRRECDVLKGPPRSTADEGAATFVDTFYKASRLHFIGSWKARIEALLLAEAGGGGAGGGAAAPRAPPPAPAPHDPADPRAPRAVIHIDLDAFFATVAEVDPRHGGAFTGLPLAVCHSASARGSAEVSSANYEARAFGVGAGMAVARALELCPPLVVVPYDFPRYEEVSEAAYRVLASASAAVAPLSCDEAFLDVTGLGDPEAIAADLRARVAAATGGVTASAGLGPNMLLARLATRRAKPNGQFSFLGDPAAAAPALAALPAAALPGVGWATARRLAALGVAAVADIRARPLALFQAEFGAAAGRALWEAAHGLDARRVEPPARRKSVGAEVNWGVRLATDAEAGALLARLAAEVGARLAAAGLAARALTVKVKRRRPGAGEPAKHLGHGVCDNLSRSAPLPRPAAGADELARAGAALLAALRVPPGEVRGLGLAAGRLVDAAAAGGAGGQRRLDSFVQPQPRQGQALEEEVASPLGGRGARGSDDSSAGWGTDPGSLPAPAAAPPPPPLPPPQRAAGAKRPRSPPGGGAPLAALPKLSEVDASVMDALPVGVRRELERAYGIAPPPRAAPRLRSPPGRPRARGGGGAAAAAAAGSKLRRLDAFVAPPPPRAPAAGVDEEITASQVDPAVLAELPLELRREVEAGLARGARRAAAAARGGGAAARAAAPRRGGADAAAGLALLRDEALAGSQRLGGGGPPPAPPPSLPPAVTHFLDGAPAGGEPVDALLHRLDACLDELQWRHGGRGGAPPEPGAPELAPGLAAVAAYVEEALAPVVGASLERAGGALRRLVSAAAARAWAAPALRHAAEALQRRVERRYGARVRLPAA